MKKILIIISILGICYLLYLNYILDVTTNAIIYPTVVYNSTTNIKHQSISNSSSTEYVSISNKISSVVPSDIKTYDVDYPNVSISNIENNSFNSHDTKPNYNTSVGFVDNTETSYSYNVVHHSSTISDITAIKYIPFGYNDYSSNKSIKNVSTSLNTNIQDNIQDNTLQKINTPTKCGHWLYHNGYYNNRHKWIPGYYEWIEEICPSVPVGDISIFGMLFFMFMYVLYIKFK